MRQINSTITLYTEMVVDLAIINNHKKMLAYHSCEQPLVLQIGGSYPNLLKQATKIAKEYGFNEVNFNVGCPSSRVQSGKFGACLMAEQNLVAECVAHMSFNIPNISVKHRLGLGYRVSYQQLQNFVQTVANSGCGKFIVHARTAILQGLNPKQNRNIPPLQYDLVYKLKQDFLKKEIIINGGVTSLEAAKKHMQYVDGVMIGRAAYYNPFMFANGSVTRQQVAIKMIPYLQQLKNSQKIRVLIRHMMGLYYNTHLAKMWRMALTAIASDNDINQYYQLVKTLPEYL